jgi:outer membrane lipoprotein SlyB
MVTRLLLIVALCASSSCATTHPTTHASTTTTWKAFATNDRGKPGHVEAVHEVTDRIEAGPGAGAVVGGLLGGLMFLDRFSSTLFGATAGAAAGTAVGVATVTQHREYEVRARFDDGSGRIFDYPDYAPFAPGDRILMIEGVLLPG